MKNSPNLTCKYCLLISANLKRSETRRESAVHAGWTDRTAGKHVKILSNYCEKQRRYLSTINYLTKICPLCKKTKINYVIIQKYKQSQHKSCFYNIVYNIFIV